MQTGAFISGGVHAALIGLVFMGGLDLSPTEPPELRISNVTLVRADLFDTVTSAAPAMPLLDLEIPDAPDTAFDTPIAPLPDEAPIETEIDITEAPDAADADPDLSAFLDVEQPDVSNVLDTVTAPSFEDSAPAIFQPAQDGNELNAPPSAMIAPPPPRNAPRIDTTAAARPADALPSLETTEAVDDGPAENIENQQQEATAAPESTTEITPEGQENVEISNFAPVTAARPPRRPQNLRIPVEEPDTSTEDAVLAAIEQAEREAAEAAAQEPVQAEMTGQETASIVSAFSPYWNMANLIGQENFEQYVVIIEFNVSAEGVVERPILPYEPSKPDGLFKVAYDAARRAVLVAGIIPLDSAKFPDGLRIRLRFDPASGEIGLN